MTVVEPLITPYRKPERTLDVPQTCDFGKGIRNIHIGDRIAWNTVISESLSYSWTPVPGVAATSILG